MLFVCWRTFVSKYLHVISKKYVTCISGEHKAFYQLSQQSDFSFMKNQRSHRRIQDPVAHLVGAFCENSWWLRVINYFCKKLHLRCLNEFWIRPCMLLPRNFLCTFREGSFTWKMLVKLRNEFLQMFRKTLPNKLVFTKKIHYIISLNITSKWSKFLCTSLLNAKK